MLVEEIRKRLNAAMKEKRAVERDILRLAMSEIQAQETRTMKPPTDEEAGKILKKIVKSNQETVDANPPEATKTLLLEEIAILESLLPKQWGIDQIVAALTAVGVELVAAKSDGQATGVAMKHLKTLGATVDGKDVTEAVKRARTKS